MVDDSRNLIVLSDGTGNSAAKPSKTNVWRLYQALDLNDGSQVAVFGDGVGTSSISVLRVLGLAFGFGVKRNVLNLYKFLCHHCHEQDLIWAFGFSRGSFTIRVLVGLICREGLVTFETEAELHRNALAAYRAYRIKAFPTAIPWVQGGRYLRDRLISFWNSITEAQDYETVAKTNVKVKVHFVGVWDTVVAYGLPIDELTQSVDRWVWPMRFRDDSLLPEVSHARHALSLDDERRTFFPVPWNESAEKKLQKKYPDIKPDRLRQVWFPGAHADVGGGYPDDGLSYVALCWMIGEAEKHGLRFEPRIVETYKAIASPTGRIYDPRAGFGAFWRYQPRDSDQLMNPPPSDICPREQRALSNEERITPLVHGSAILRMVYGNDGYAPISLPKEINVLPPNGAPIAFEHEAIEQALATARHDCSRPLPYPQRHALEERLQFLTDMRKLGPSADTLRTQLFALVQDTVWWRRIVYFVSLFLALMAGAYPLLAEYLRVEEVDILASGSTSWAIGLINGFLPRFTEPWLAALGRHPGVAGLIIVALLISLRISGFLQHRIHDRARAAWNVRERVDHLRLTGQRHGLVKGTIIFGALAIAVLILGGDRYLLLFALFAALSLACFVSWLRRRGARPRKTDPAQPGLLLSLARRLRQQPYVVVGYRFIARTVAPAVFLGLGTFAAVSVAHRTVFDLLSTVGTYCKATEKDGSPENKNDNSEQEKLGVGKILFTNSMCHETGLSLISGRKYRIALEMDDVWFDKDVRTDVGGFSAASVNRPLFYLASPLKRWWQENWFQPIARIGAVGNYEQALKPAEPLPLAGPGIQPSKLLVSDITADATGELFLYVNDAVVTWFGLTDWFYRNNKGSAKVTVTRLVAPQMIETQK